MFQADTCNTILSKIRFVIWVILQYVFENI